MTDKKEGVQVTIPAEVHDGEKVDLVVEAENVVVNTPMERNGEPGGAKATMDEMPADIQAVMDRNSQVQPAKPEPKTKRVKTGKNVMTGEDVMKDVQVPEEKDYSEGRKLFPVHTAVNGSYNGRRINLVKGEEVHLSPRELQIFRAYVSGEGK